MVREERGLNSCQGEWEGEQTSEGRIAGSTKVPPEVRGRVLGQTNLLALRFSSLILSCSAAGVRKLDFIMTEVLPGKDSAGREF